MYRSDELQCHFDDLMTAKLHKEIQDLASKKNKSSELLEKDPHALANIEPVTIIKQWKKDAPLFVQ